MSESTSTPGPLDGLDADTLRSVADALWQAQLDPSTIPADVLAALGSEANSPEAYGHRMRAFLKYLIEHPVDHTPSYEKTYEHLLPFCSRLSPQQAYAIAVNLLGPPASIGYDMVPAKANFEFPRDFGTKPRSAVGWHFFVGSCWDEDGAEYGVELMFFQAGIFPPPLAAGFGLTEDENQVVEVQFAVSKAGDAHWQADPVCLGGTSGLVTHTANPFSYHVGRSSMVCHDVDEFFPITIKAWGVDRGAEPSRELSVDITFTTGKQYLFQGADGCMPAVDGVGSLYYSIPNIALDPTCSTLTLDGRTVRLVRGQFWFDRQWGYISGVSRSKVMRAASFSTNPNPAGWDWFMAQFTDDRQITVFAPHATERAEYYEQTGPQQPGTMTVRVGGTYMDANRDQALTWGTLRITDWIKAVSSPNPVRYAVTDTWYPNRWEFEFDDVVPEDIRLVTMTPDSPGRAGGVLRERSAVRRGCRGADGSRRHGHRPRLRGVRGLRRHPRHYAPAGRAARQPGARRLAVAPHHPGITGRAEHCLRARPSGGARGDHRRVRRAGVLHARRLARAEARCSRPAPT